MGGNFKRQDDMDDDSARLAMGSGPGSGSKGSDSNDKPQVIIDIASDFDNFVREVFEVEPPLGEFGGV
jgi:hypothetical protein